MRVLAITTEAESFSAIAARVETADIIVAGSISAGLAQLSQGTWSLVLLDSALDADLTLELLERLVAAKHRVIVVVREDPMALIFKALERGAADVLVWPPSVSELREALARCAPSPVSHTRPFGEEKAPRAGSTVTAAPPALVGESGGMLAAVKTVARVADSTATVLLQGESGTGKELFARLLHDKSARAAEPFVAINCAAIPDALVESELFGHEKGAFTGAVGRKIGRFERAHGGTLFLDEIGDLSLSAQAKVLRVLQEQEIERVGGEAPVQVDVRIVAATNRDLGREVAHGRFREDLFYRLAVVVIALPPLRARGDDIRLLAEHCVARFACKHHRPTRAISRGALMLMGTYSWPGNVRQLYNVLEHAVLTADGPVLLPAHLPRELRSPAQAFAGATSTPARGPSAHGSTTPGYGLAIQGIGPYGTVAYGSAPTAHAPEVRSPMTTGASGHDVDSLLPLGELERRHIAHAMALTGGHLARAADLLGIHRNTLRRKLQEHEDAAVAGSVTALPPDASERATSDLSSLGAFGDESAVELAS